MSRIFLVGLLASGLLFGSNIKTFDHVFGGKKDDIGTSVIEITDGYLISAKSKSFSEHEFDGYIIKIDKSGKMIWENHYGGKNNDCFKTVVPYRDGFMLLGITESVGNRSKSFYLAEIDQNGTLLSSYAKYTHEYDEFIGKVLAVDGEDIIMGGNQKHVKLFDAEIDPLIFKTNRQAQTIWGKYYGGEDEDYIYNMLQIEDGYILVGKTESFDADEFDGYVVKIDKNGTKQWYNTFGGEENDVAYDIAPTPDGYMMVGTSESFDLRYKHVYVTKIDKTGKVLWEKLYGNDKEDDEGHAIATDKDNNYIIAGYTESQDREKRDELHLLKIDGDGKKLWNKSYGNKADDAGHDIIATEDGGYLVVGDKKSEKTRDSNVWVLKVDKDGNL